jgi:hypothetical protein
MLTSGLSRKPGNPDFHQKIFLVSWLPAYAGFPPHAKDATGREGLLGHFPLRPLRPLREPLFRGFAAL